MTSFQKMSLKSSSLFALCFSSFLLFNTVRASNITQILSQYPDFSTFSSYLTQTQLAGEINSRQTITVLVVENGNMSPLSGKPNGEIKNVLSGHVILDYYDVAKLQKLQNKTAMLTTLFQSSGQAKGQQGFLNVTVLGSNSVAFGSAVPGSSLSSNLVKSVSSQPYNISVLQVSNIIVSAGTGNANSTTSPVPVGPPKTSPTPASSPNKPPSTSNPPPSKAPAPSTTKPPPTHAPAPSMAKPPAASAPSATPPAMSISPVGGPSPTTADGPAADSPAPSPPAMDGPIAATPAADGPLADAPLDPKSDASVLTTGNNLALLALIILSAFFLA